jgi:hypothetical protein
MPKTKKPKRTPPGADLRVKTEGSWLATIGAALKKGRPGKPPVVPK